MQTESIALALAMIEDKNPEIAVSSLGTIYYRGGAIDNEVLAIALHGQSVDMALRRVRDEAVNLLAQAVETAQTVDAFEEKFGLRAPKKAA